MRHALAALQRPVIHLTGGSQQRQLWTRSLRGEASGAKLFTLVNREPKAKGVTSVKDVTKLAKAFNSAYASHGFFAVNQKADKIWVLVPESKVMAPLDLLQQHLNTP